MVQIFPGAFVLVFFLAFGNAEEASCSAKDTSCMKAANEGKEDIIPGRELIEWIKEYGGYISNKQEVRRETPGDSSSVVGVFATEQIRKGELLFSIPWENAITGEFDDCDVPNFLVNEFRQGNASDFAPYIRYLLSKPQGNLPVDSWSDAGIDLLGKVIGENLPPQGITNRKYLKWWREVCGASEDPLEENLAFLALSRGNKMVPFYDMYNHHNGWLNTHLRESEKKGIELIELYSASSIKTGDQIYTSYNKCDVLCEDLDVEFHTSDIFEKYGFVESMPQQWEFGSVMFNLVEDINGDIKFQHNFKSFHTYHSQTFEEELERLKTVAHEEQHQRHGVPDNEWDLIWQYHEVLVAAISGAIESIESKESNWADNQEYATCDEHLPQSAYVDLDKYRTRSMYQEIEFSKNPENEDMCLFLDNTLQICDSYRPHYHDPFVHFSSAYLKNLKRVVIVGGGDSMLLHDVLQYPTVELVLALELDQAVVRHSFKHFKTQPHFDDERVQFWFGDAAKSINLLPKDLFGTFDLVLVDLSETVMSNTVTKKLDMIGALTLLLKPDGIFVKNEWYFKQLSKLFDFTISLYMKDVPQICDQEFAMGSNNIDFLSPNFELMKNHSIKPMLNNPLEDPMDHHHLIKYYSKNDAPLKKEICDQHLEGADHYDQVTPGVGLLLVVEAEHTTEKLQPVADLESSIFSLLKVQGFTPISTMSYPAEHNGDIVVIIMREGFVAFHTWIEYNYCALDIQLWGGFGKLDQIRSAILEVVGSKKGSWSSFRLVVGGMHGTSTWKDDHRVIGPDTGVACENSFQNSKPSGDILIDDTTFTIMIEESLNILEDDDTVVVVICGDPIHGCKSLETVGKGGRFTNVIAFWDCPSKEGNEPDVEKLGSGRHILLCGKNSVDAFKETFDEFGKIGSVIFDALAPIDTISRDAKRIFTGSENSFTGEVRESDILKPNVLIMSPLLDESQDKLPSINSHARRIFLNETLERLRVEPVLHANVVVYGNEGSIDIGFVSSGEPAFAQRLRDITGNIKRRSGLNAEIKNITGSIDKFQYNFNAHFYAVEDYDRLPGIKQFSTQQPLGHQSIFQLQIENASAEKISIAKLHDVLDRTVSQLTNSGSVLEKYSDVGDGILLVAIVPVGHIIVVWDGSAYVDFNIFTHSESINHETEIVNPFMSKMGITNTVLRDNYPRGAGRVVNFMKDFFFPDDNKDQEEDSFDYDDNNDLEENKE
eukprot:CAMPEP_0195540490 /NCGR_PEP_ID=MMETSP0794_2-20130614/50599_1 /TAXON_ID=515487 /ORGANISM="Stephanopyxis turris, Strain CCMP 815" /LENGTH=1223 /DNA_ID=CAMNT_0040674559 /DNA_START=125 /DNA_END=3797 /DNA_ORIENTATION=+